jgi:hypothetical protein
VDIKQGVFVRRAVSCTVGIAVTGVSRVVRVRAKSRRLFLRRDKKVTAITAWPIRARLPMALTTTMIVERSVWMGERWIIDTWLMIEDKLWVSVIRGEAQ